VKIKIILCIEVIFFFGILIGGIIEFIYNKTGQNVQKDVNTIIPSPWSSKTFLLLNYDEEIKEWNPDTGESNNLPLPFKKSGNIDEMYIYLYKSGIILYTHGGNNDTKLYFAKNKPIQENSWETFKVNLKGQFIGTLGGYFVSIENNHLYKNNPITNKTTAWLKVENNPITSPDHIVEIPSVVGQFGITQGSGGIIRLNPDSNSYEKVFTLPTPGAAMVMNMTPIRLSYVESPYGNYIFLNEPNSGEYISSNEGKSFKSADTGLENYFIRNVIYDQVSSRFLGFTYSGRTVFSYNLANNTWSPVKTSSPWAKID
jgi:hypothetical protein